MDKSEKSILEEIENMSPEEYSNEIEAVLEELVSEGSVAKFKDENGEVQYLKLDA